MLLGGVESSNAAIEWAFVELLKKPKLMKKLQDELDHVVGHERVVDEDDILQLEYLQAAWAIHRHPSAYDNPWDFNPERFVGSEVDLKGTNFELLPFGCGRRMCAGLPLGLITVQMGLARLLHSFTWKLPLGENPQDIDMGEVFGVTTPKAIPLQAIGIARLPLHIYATR
jgi:cytochrome P450